MNLAFISVDEAKTFIFLILLRSISLITPPASLIKTIPAAMSHKFKLLCAYPSSLPDATYAISSAAHPDLL